jgi:hypothetical protein
MTKPWIALVCAIAGLVTIEGFLAINAIAEGIYNCNPDPYYPEMCSGQAMASFAILIGPWVVATYLLARREAIGPFACVVMGLMWWLALIAAAVLYEYVRPSPKLPAGQADPFSGFWADFLMYGLTAVLVIGLLTAVFGFAMQAVIRARRRRRPESLGEKAQGIARKGRGPVVGALILTTLATAGVVVSSHFVESSPVGDEMVQVVVSKVDIPPRTDLDELVKDDQLKMIYVPERVVLDGTVTSVDQLQDRRNTVAILAGELILAGRLKIGAGAT